MAYNGGHGVSLMGGDEKDVMTRLTLMLVEIRKGLMMMMMKKYGMRD